MDGPEFSNSDGNTFIHLCIYGNFIDQVVSAIGGNGAHVIYFCGSDFYGNGPQASFTRLFGHVA